MIERKRLTYWVVIQRPGAAWYEALKLMALSTALKFSQADRGSMAISCGTRLWLTKTLAFEASLSAAIKAHGHRPGVYRYNLETKQLTQIGELVLSVRVQWLSHQETP